MGERSSGLPGMHERATLAGGKLALRSKLGAGTEAELTIPPSCAYLNRRRGRNPRLRENGTLRIIVDRSCAVAIVLAAVFTSAYTARKIAAANHEQRDAFAVFGRAVVQDAAAHRRRYGVVGGEEEGMLLYVRRTEFLESAQAAADWNAGKLDALVVADDEIDGLIPQLHGEPKKLLTSGRGGRYGKRYFLLVR